MKLDQHVSIGETTDDGENEDRNRKKQERLRTDRHVVGLIVNLVEPLAVAVTRVVLELVLSDVLEDFCRG